ncbi:MAG: hypothetical protein AAFX02_07035 [Pseudomonadota bacterium]
MSAQTEPGAGELSEYYKTALAAYEAGDRDQAKTVWRYACRNGDRRSCEALGLRQYLIRQKSSEIAWALEYGCDLGSGASCLALGQGYEMGTIGRGDLLYAATYYEKACVEGNNRGCAFLGQNMYLGFGIPKDRAKGRRLMREACRAGDEYGCDRLQEYGIKP